VSTGRARGVDDPSRPTPLLLLIGIGKTDKAGTTVEERLVSAVDFMATVCKVLGIDHTKQNQTRIGRPVRIAENGAKPIDELF
jgi:hypothetical protein